MARDRDQSFETALAQNLRATARGAASQAHACADAELLAAYHERSLSSAESASLKQHIDTCSRCQQILAHLEETDAIAVESPEPVTANVPATPAALRERAAAAPVSKPRWIFPWRWLTPAGAVAAALLVWIVTREQKLPNIEVAKNVEVAKHDAPSASSSARAPLAEPLSSSADTTVAPKAPAAAPAPRLRSEAGPVPKTAQTFAPEPQREESGANTRGFAAEKQPPQPTARDKDALSQKKQLASPSNNSIARDYFDNAPALDETNIDGKLERRSKVDKIAPAPQPAPPPPAPSVEAAMSAPAESKRADVQAKAVGGAAGQGLQQQQEIGGRSLYVASSAESAVVLAKSKGLALITAPGGKVLWRPGPAGIIERSTDAGNTWTLQTSGVVDDLLVGSAPSDKVCWIAGRAGIIVRTTDGGAHWQKIQAPVTRDLSLIFAVNANQATISADQEAYQTTDGGLTWKKLNAE